MIEYFNEDCMIGMARYPDKYFDLIVTSPPYNLGNQHHTGNKRFKAYNKYSDDMPEEKYQIWQTNVLNECHRVLKDDGAMFYNHKNRIRNGVQISPYEWILKTNFIVKQEIVWFNGSRFGEDAPNDFYGLIEDGWAYVVRSEFDKIMSQEGFSSRAVLNDWYLKGLIQTEENSGKTRYTKRRRIKDKRANFVVVSMPKDEED